MKTLIVSHEKCTACRLCELGCSLKHEGAFYPARSRIVTEIFPEEDFYLPLTCQQCDPAPCMDACPAGALHRNEATGAVEVAEERCIGCRMCVMVCPFAAITPIPETNKVAKCDLCGGEPECVAFCPWGALEYVEADAATASRRRDLAERLRNIIGEVAV